MLVFSLDGLQQCFKVGKDVPLVSYNCDQLKLGRQIPNPQLEIVTRPAQQKLARSSKYCQTEPLTYIMVYINNYNNPQELGSISPYSNPSTRVFLMAQLLVSYFRLNLFRWL